RHPVALHQLADHAGVERTGVEYKLDPIVQREPERHVAERVEQRQDAEQTVFRFEPENLRGRLYVRVNVEVTEQDTLRFPRAAAAENDGGDVIDRGAPRGATGLFQ